MWSHFTSRVNCASRAAHSSGDTSDCGSTPGSSWQYDLTSTSSGRTTGVSPWGDATISAVSIARRIVLQATTSTSCSPSTADSAIACVRPRPLSGGSSQRAKSKSSPVG